MEESRTSSETRHFLRHPTELAWADFVDRYAPRLLLWCRNRGLGREACEDVTQEVLTRLHRSMHTYTEGRSFRGWLYGVTRNAIHDYFNSLRSSEIPMPAGLDALPALEEDVTSLIAEQDLLQVAMERTRLSAPPRQWEVFELHVLQHCDYDELEAKLGLRRAVLMNYLSAVRRLLSQELRKLDET